MNLAAEVPMPIRSLYFEGCSLANLPQTRDAGVVLPWDRMIPRPGSATHPPMTARGGCCARSRSASPHSPQVRLTQTPDVPGTGPHGWPRPLFLVEGWFVCSKLWRATHDYTRRPAETDGSCRRRGTSRAERLPERRPGPRRQPQPGVPGSAPQHAPRPRMRDRRCGGARGVQGLRRAGAPVRRELPSRRPDPRPVHGSTGRSLLGAGLPHAH